MRSFWIFLSFSSCNQGVFFHCSSACRGQCQLTCKKNCTLPSNSRHPLLILLVVVVMTLVGLFKGCFLVKEFSKVCLIHITSNGNALSMQQNFSARCHGIVLRRHQNKRALCMPSAAFRQENNSHIFFSCSLISWISNIALLKFVLSLEQEYKLFNLFLPEMRGNVLLYWCKQETAGI